MLFRKLISGAAAILALAQTARSQEVAAEGNGELPAVIVEGATIEAKSRSKPKAKKLTPSAAGKKSSAAAQSDSQASDSTSPEAATSGDAVEPGGEGVAEADSGSGSGQANSAEQGGAGDAVDGIPLPKVGSAVTVVTGAELKAQQVRTAAEALRSLPGVSVSRQGGPQSQTVVRIRGAESNHTLVLIDGVELNAAGSDGFFDFSTLLVDDIAQIEVIRGPQSGLYSSGALGGVINIVTHGGKGPLTLRAQAEGGTFGTRSGMVGISGGTERAHANFTASGLETDGFDISDSGSERDGGQFSTFAFNGGALVFDNLKLDATLRRARRDGDRDGTDDVLNGLSVASEDRSTFASDIWLGRLQATLDTFDGAWVHKAFVSGVETDNSDRDFGAFSPPEGNPSRNISTASKYGFLSTLRLEQPGGLPVRHFITGLVEHQREQFEQPLVSPAAFERDRDSVAGEIRGEYFDALTLTGNIRHDDNEGFDNATTWRVAGSLQPAGSPFRLHSSVGTGIKYPSFSEQFGVFFGFVSNPNLKPETSFGWDVGVETSFLAGKGIIDVTYFKTNLQDEIDFDFVPPATVCGSLPFCFTPFNRDGESKREGIEVAARLALVEGLSVGLSYTYLKAREFDGKEEVRRPPHSGRADINYAFDAGRGNFNLAAVYNGRMQDIAFRPATFASERVLLDEYWLVSAAASYKIAPGVELFGRVENLLDQRYEEVFGFNAAGLAAYGGIRVTFEEPSTLHWSR